MQRDGMYVGIEPLDNDRDLPSTAEMTRLLSMSTLCLRLTSEEGRVLSRKFQVLCVCALIVVLTSSADAPTFWVRYQLDQDKSTAYSFRAFHSKVAVVGQYATPLIAISVD